MARGERIELRWFLRNDAIAVGLALPVALGFVVLAVMQVLLGGALALTGEVPEEPAVWVKAWSALAFLAVPFGGLVALRWLYVRWLLWVGVPCEATLAPLEPWGARCRLPYRYRWRGRELARTALVMGNGRMAALAAGGRGTAIVHPRLPRLACLREVFRAPPAAREREGGVAPASS